MCQWSSTHYQKRKKKERKKLKNEKKTKKKPKLYEQRENNEMTVVEVGDAIQVAEFGNACSSLQKYQDQPKVDFAQLIGVNPNNWVASLSGVQEVDYPNAPTTGQNATPPVLHEGIGSEKF